MTLNIMTITVIKLGVMTFMILGVTKLSIATLNKIHIQHNDIQRHDIRHNDTQHDTLKMHNDTWYEVLLWLLCLVSLRFCPLPLPLSHLLTFKLGICFDLNYSVINKTNQNE
jgi:hypothetical protein